MRRKQRHDMRSVFLQPAKIRTKAVAKLTICIRKNIRSRLCINQALMKMHSTAGGMGHGFSHEGRMKPTVLRSLSSQPFEIEHLIRLPQGIGVHEIDFNLAFAHLLDGTGEFNSLRRSVLMHGFNERRILGHRFYLKRPGAVRYSTGNTRRGPERVQRIRVVLHQVEFGFLGDYRPQSKILEFADDLFKD